MLLTWTSTPVLVLRRKAGRRRRHRVRTDRQVRKVIDARTGGMSHALAAGPLIRGSNRSVRDQGSSGVCDTSADSAAYRLGHAPGSDAS